MKLKIFASIIFLLISIMLVSCGTSTATRYSEGGKSAELKKEEKAKGEKEIKKYPENFNLSGYHTKINVKDTNRVKEKNNLNLWYTYHEAPDTGDVNRTVIKTESGYRVQVLSTDNLDDANKMRSEIYFKTSQKAVYIVFDPPFYKVEVGDFTDINDAKSLSFKFKQMGYSDSRVVNSTINIFQQQ